MKVAMCQFVPDFLSYVSTKYWISLQLGKLSEK